ncbi:MAG: Fe-S cluster assembly protein SufD [Gemmataceae bacterium]
MTSSLANGLHAAKQRFLDAYAVLEAQLTEPLLRRVRQAGIAAFDTLGFPGPRDEDWKNTPLQSVLAAEYATCSPDLGQGWHEVNGVTVCPLSWAVRETPELVERYLGRVVEARAGAMIALNTAFISEGIFIYVPANTLVLQPISLEFTTTGPGAWHRRVLVVVERGAQLTLVEHHTSCPAQGTLSTKVAEIVVAENAQVDHYLYQDEDRNAALFSTLAVQLARDSRFRTHYFGFGGSLVRHEARVRFGGENAEATVNGLYQGTGTQHYDNFTVIDHAVPHCNSHELYKGILDDQARGVFTGKIYVRPDAQKTDAKQTNQTLLLSDDATINTKPQLEIFADDVKCTHGATVGQLDDRQRFYLRSRGISDTQARALLTFAFANDLIGRVQVPELRRTLERRLLQTHHLPEIEDDE